MVFCARYAWCWCFCDLCCGRVIIPNETVARVGRSFRYWIVWLLSLTWSFRHGRSGCCFVTRNVVCFTLCHDTGLHIGTTTVFGTYTSDGYGWRRTFFLWHTLIKSKLIFSGMIFLVVVLDARREMIFFGLIFLVVLWSCVLVVGVVARWSRLICLVAELIIHLILNSLHFVTSE